MDGRTEPGRSSTTGCYVQVLTSAVAAGLGAVVLGPARVRARAGVTVVVLAVGQFVSTHTRRLRAWGGGERREGQVVSLGLLLHSVSLLSSP